MYLSGRMAAQPCAYDNHNNMSVLPSFTQEEVATRLQALIRVLRQSNSPASAIRDAADDVFFAYKEEVRPLQIEATWRFLMEVYPYHGAFIGYQADRDCALTLLNTFPLTVDSHRAEFRPIAQFANTGIELCKWAHKVCHKSKHRLAIATRFDCLTRLLKHLIEFRDCVLDAFSSTGLVLNDLMAAMARYDLNVLGDEQLRDKWLRTLQASIQRDFAKAQYGPSQYGLEHYMQQPFFQ